MEYLIPIIVILIGLQLVVYRWAFKKKRERRRIYYRNEYLKSDDWKRKRYVVLKRDNWRCVYCGAPATQVHHKKYARRNIGREPIEWLVSVCKSCHESRHNWGCPAVFSPQPAIWRVPTVDCRLLILIGFKFRLQKSLGRRSFGGGGDVPCSIFGSLHRPLAPSKSLPFPLLHAPCSLPPAPFTLHLVPSLNCLNCTI